MSRAANAIVLFAHGSRDPLWSKPIEAVAARVRELDPSAMVACAYLELMQPDLPTAVRSLVADGAGHISVVPMFLGVGRHARQDLPELVAMLQRAHPGLGLRLQAAIGEDPRLVDLMAQIALG